MVGTIARDEVVVGGGPEDFPTVRYIRLEGTDREIGRALAEIARREHGASAGPIPAEDPVVQRVRWRWFRANHAPLAERIRGIADAFDVDPDDPRWDLGGLGTFDLPAGCSAVWFPAEGTKEGHGLLARNFDFPTATLTQMIRMPPVPGERPLSSSPYVVELRPEGGYASVTVGIMDLLGAMDGMNEAGLTVALLADNESPDPEPTFRSQVGLSEQQVVRFLLDTCATVDQAKEALLAAKHYYMFMPSHFLVADRSGAAFVWEHSRGHNAEHIVDARAGRMVCTNHLLHRWPDADRLPREGEALTYDRYRALSAMASDPALVDRDAIREQLAAVRCSWPVEGSRTIWNAIYDTDEPSLEVSFFLRDEGGRSRYSAPFSVVMDRNPVRGDAPTAGRGVPRGVRVEPA